MTKVQGWVRTVDANEHTRRIGDGMSAVTQKMVAVSKDRNGEEFLKKMAVEQGIYKVTGTLDWVNACDSSSPGVTPDLSRFERRLAEQFPDGQPPPGGCTDLEIVIPVCSVDDPVVFGQLKYANPEDDIHDGD